MKSKRKRHTAEFKAKVALEAIKNVKTIQELAKEYDLHPVQISEWKKRMLDGASDIFATGKSKPKQENFEAERDKLHAKIGQQAVEIDFLVKKSKELGL